MALYADEQIVATTPEGASEALQLNFEWERERSLDEQFETFKAHHADVLALFKKYSYDLKRAGRKKAGAKAIVERLRWDYLTSAHGVESPALNNNLVSRMARWLMSECPDDFRDFFELRALKSRSEP